MLRPRISRWHGCVEPPPAIFRSALSAYPLLATALGFLLAVFLFATSSSAQSSTATLSGTVEDQSGALIAGASIALINTSQGTQHLATTNEEGQFVFTRLPPGKYSLRIISRGFAHTQFKELVLNGNKLVSLRISLRGDVSESTKKVENGGDLTFLLEFALKLLFHLTFLALILLFATLNKKIHQRLSG